MRVALTIAGSDSGGGAGIQADLKTFAAHGVYGLSAITAVTAQNTVEVRTVEQISPSVLESQIEAVLDDIPVHAVKIGMIGCPDACRVVAGKLKKYGAGPVVLDPVMVSKGGHRLLQKEAIAAIRNELLPIVSLVTPNIPEAEELAGMDISTLGDRKKAGRIIQSFGVRSVLLKGGHLPGEPDDLLLMDDEWHVLKGKRIITTTTHGTGCTLSSAIAANLATGNPLLKAAESAKKYIESAIRHGLDIGKGYGPTQHFADLYALAGHPV